MRTIASRAFMIFGSGTSRTSSFVVPIQQLAFMTGESLGSCGGLCFALQEQPPCERAFGCAFGAHDFARLDDLFEATQVVLHLLDRLFAEQLRDGGAERTGRRLVFDLH